MFYSGQVILYKDGPNTISRLIRLIQGNEITHCALVLKKDNSDPYILEIENISSTVKIKKLSETLSYSDEIYVATNTTFTSTVYYTGKFLAQYINKRYSKAAIANALLNHFFGLFNKHYVYKQYIKVNNRFTCSSLVADVLSYVSPYKCKDSSLVEPDDFTVAPWVLTKIK